MRSFFAPRNLSVACLAVVLATVVWVPLCFGPQPEKPEKISIDIISWNSGALFVEHSALFGIATAGHKAGFTIKTVLMIYDGEGELCAVLEQEDPLFLRQRSDADGFTRLAPQMIEWDRVCPSDPSQLFVGMADVIVLSEAINPASRTTASAIGMFTVDISDPDR